MHGFFCRFYAYHGRFAKGHDRTWNHASPHWLARNHAQHQPDNSEKDRGEHVSEKMCAQSDPAESHQEDQSRSAANAEQPPMARFEDGQDKQQELSVKESSSNRVAAGKTVTRPIHERAINERTMSMDELLNQLI